MTALNSKVQIDREGFKNACIKHTGISFLDMTTNDMNRCADEFGIDIHMYFTNYLLCVVKDEEKLFLNRLRYGF
jgi:hypothetical protein